MSIAPEAVHDPFDESGDYDSYWGPKAKVILDSVSPQGVRLTTWEVMFHRFILAEVNTHRDLSRNSASSRAIPVEKQIGRVKEHPAWPLVWPAEQPGMQGGDELTGKDLEAAQGLFRAVWRDTLHNVESYLNQVKDQYGPEMDDIKSHRLHKSLVNRLLEPFMWHTAIVTTVKYRNLFLQRVSPLAQPEFKAVAACMLEALKFSEPRPVQVDEWHRPYIRPSDEEWVDALDGDIERFDLLNRISVARCARVSYLTHDTGVCDPQKDLGLYNSLEGADPMHASPLEHVATPVHPFSDDPLWSGQFGNLHGWVQYRHIIERRLGKGSIFGSPSDSIKPLGIDLP